MLKNNLVSILFASFFLIALSFFTLPASAQTCTDTDGDGYGLNGDASCPNAGVDCDDTDPNTYPGAPKICDARDNNCDGLQDFFTDKDEDGDGVTSCNHWQTGLKDCNDTNPNMYPGNVEGPFGDPTCSDGIDNNCNNKTDSSDIGCSVTCVDTDGDGYGNPGNVTCPNGNALDCNDTNGAINPGASDANCNGVDENCSGAADEGYGATGTNCGVGECASTGTLSCSGGVETDSCAAGTPAKEGALGHPTCSDTLDNDCDGTTDGSDPGCQSSCLDDDGDGYGYYGDASCPNGSAVDCDDDNGAINPGASDANCNGVDENCSGAADEDYGATVTNCGTGECATTGLLVCSGGTPIDNCAPLAPGVEGPFGDPTCSDTLDNDCDGVVDGPDNDCNPLDQDNDGDGFCEAGPCQNPANLGGDCNDVNPLVYPGAPKICDGLDNNCDGFQDFFTDKDADGDGVLLCAHYQTGLQDCDDNNANRFPGNIEAFGHPSCSDGIDNDCNYKIDIKDTKCLNQCNDADGDGYGNPGHASCTNGNALDCNDTNGAINPGVPDANCNGVDENCSGAADEGYVTTGTNCGVGECANTGTLSCSGGIETDSCIPLVPGVEGPLGSATCTDTVDNDCDGDTDGADPGCLSSCLDDDGDGYGVFGDPSCTNPGADCDDTNSNINPGAADTTCNGADENCSGAADEGYVPAGTNCGVGECATTGLLICTAGSTVDNCSPLAPGVEGPFGDPTCSDTLDNDCDGIVDGPDPDCTSVYEDSDGDGYCEVGPCNHPGNLPGDCDDTNPDIYPGAPRVCDGKDSDCDGFQDFYTDKDVDGDGVPLCVHYQTGLQDCDDNDANRFPGNIEAFGDPSCSDGIDNDCNYKIDLKDTKCLNQCNDGDGDGYGNPGHASCTNGSALDCNDGNSLINPGASDTNCDGVDNNCSGAADEGYVATGTNCGVGGCASTGTLTCSGGVLTDSCTPLAPAVEGPLGNATCTDTVDNDCDGDTDGADPGCLSSCLDDDGDGYGVFGDPSCTNPGADCDDTNSNINPGAADTTCNGADENCSGAADEGYVPTGTNCGVGECATTGQMVCNAGALEDTCTPLAPGVESYLNPPSCTDTLDNDCDGDADLFDLDCNPLDVDNDGDGFCEIAPCQNPANLGGDCDDEDPTVHPGGSTTVCDAKDTNCDGFQDFFTDKDVDGDGVPLCAGDCDDNDPNRFPGNREGPWVDPTCFDGIDNDCDNKIDAPDADCAEPTCTTRTNPRNGPHMFDLLDGGDNVLKTACIWCHFDNSGTVDERHKCERCHADPAWGGPDDGTLKALYSGNPPYGFGTALNVRLHSSTVLGTKYGAWDMNCVTCHNPHFQEQDSRYETSYGKLIKEKICFDNAVTSLNAEEFVEFTAPSGAGSFADGPPQNENICEMCHTQTSYHQRTGLSPAHNDGTDCADCHLHEDGFKPSCGSCHAAPPPTGSHLTHYGGNTDFAAYGDTRITEDYVSQETAYIMNCGNCHPIDSVNHQNGVLNAGGGDAQIELYNADAPAGSLKALNSPAATYTPGVTVFTDADGFNYTQGTCSNVYCHSVTEFSSSGAVPEPTIPIPPTVWPPLEYSTPWESYIIKSTQFQSPVWGGGTLGCDGCHGYPITLPSTVSAGIGDSHAWIDDYLGYINMHVWNMGYTPLQCNTCHYNTVQAEDPNYVRDDFSIFFNDIPIHNTAYHVNGTKDIAFNPAPYVYPPGELTNGATYDLTTTTFFPAGTLYPNEATCVNAPCHQAQVEVKWGTPYRWWLTATECNVCHHN